MEVERGLRRQVFSFNGVDLAEQLGIGKMETQASKGWFFVRERGFIKMV